MERQLSAKSLTFLTFLFFLMGFPSQFCLLNAKPSQSPMFDITKSPSKTDWQRFYKSSETWKAGFWQHHRKMGHQLSDWAWEWRIAWLQTCAKVEKNWCQAVFKSGLQDKAVVVRNTAAQKLGEKYRGTGNKAVLNLLVRAARDKRNFRNNKPLFVQMNILYAIKKVGGKKALQSGGRIATGHSATNTYWQRLNRG